MKFKIIIQIYNFINKIFGTIAIIIAIISQCAIFNTYITAGSRGFLVMSDDNLSTKF